MSARSPELARRFFTNLGRVRNLIDCHAALQPLAPPGADDVLRAAVVLLHATLEDLLREAEGMALRADPALRARALTLPDGLERFTMAELAPFLGSTVADLFEQSVARYLNQRTYSNIGQIAAVLRDLGLRTDPWLKSLAPPLDQMTSRRHLIAHYADQTVDASGRTLQRPIHPAVLAPWIVAVEHIGDRVIAHLGTQPPAGSSP
jgi:hypothetical protein